MLVVEEGQPLGWVEPERLGSGAVELSDLNRSGVVAAISASPREALDAALSSPTGRGVIVDETGEFLGTVRASDVIALLEAERATS